MNIGVLGGTFDPIHIGHLILAEEARESLNLDKILFIPAGQPWLKNSRSISSSTHRVAMVSRAIAGNKYFQLSTLEVDRAGDSFTVDTMEVLNQLYSAGTEFFFIIGQDSLQAFPSWKNPARLLQLCQLVVVDRPLIPPLDLPVLEQTVPGITRRMIQLHMPGIALSSTDIRERIAHGRSIRYLVPPAVEEYILKHGLYR